MGNSMSRTRAPLPPPPEPLHKRVINRLKRIRNDKQEFTIFLGACFTILILVVYNFVGLVNLFSSQDVKGFDQLTANAGYVANTEHTIRLALFSFDGAVGKVGVSTTTVLTPNGTILSSTLAPDGNLDILSNNNAVPHFIQFRSIQYRKINPTPNVKTSLFDTPSAETWTNDLTEYKGLILDYKNIVNPSLLLSNLLPILVVDNSQKKSDGSLFISLSGNLNKVSKALNNFIPKATLVSGAKILVYVTLDKGRNLKRVMVVFPDGSSILVSNNGKASKIVDKPDLTRVVPSLKLKAKVKK